MERRILSLGNATRIRREAVAMAAALIAHSHGPNISDDELYEALRLHETRFPRDFWPSEAHRDNLTEIKITQPLNTPVPAKKQLKKITASAEQIYARDFFGIHFYKSE